MQTDVSRVPCRPQDASLPCSTALPAPSSQQKVVPGPPSPRKCLTPGAPGSLPQRWRPWETPECFPKGKCPPPAPEVSSVSPALPGTPLSPHALQSLLSSQETHLCMPRPLPPGRLWSPTLRVAASVSLPDAGLQRSAGDLQALPSPGGTRPLGLKPGLV
ncbi:unnamed protein product [Rangifer tarandus platyrhynchus]|uniref:Uncharacterized protein n=2 Tax=Rangifer tarandus platyrhynchus TaxID=3082113 RepID=A0ACB0ETI3_RANTA|nr:unnamed protein product [Rangifer tarandus platyrhynchus]CAI9704015.1 unnamed protein product [Rangifer tarandus platyrhynchus]